jgi:hypothetical protein
VLENSHNFTLNEAAKEIGRSKGTISKALNNGKLSYISKNKSHHQTQNQRYSHHEFYGFYPCYYRLVYLSITQQGVAIQCLKTAHYSSFAT